MVAKEMSSETTHHENVAILPRTEPFYKTVAAYPKLVGYCLIMASGPLLFGYDIFTVGVCTALPYFKVVFGQEYHKSHIISSLWLGLWTAFISLGIMFGSYGAGLVMSRAGRRPSYFLAGLISAIGVLGIYFADRSANANTRRGIFLLGKIIIGFGIGGALSTNLTYISEVAPRALRGMLLGVFSVSVATGQLIAMSVMYTRFSVYNSSSYRVAFLGELALSGLVMLAAVIVPESPVFLLKTNRREKAIKSYRRLHRPEEVDTGMAHLEMLLEEEVQLENSLNRELSYRDLFKGVNFRRTRIIFWANMLQQLVGNPLMPTSTYFFELIGLSNNATKDLTEAGLSIAVVASVLVIVLINRVGRRTSLLGMTSFLTVMWLGIGIAGCFRHSDKATMFIGVALIINSTFIAGGVGTVYPVISAEASSLQLRALSQGFAFIVNGFFTWLFAFFTPYLFNAGDADLEGLIGFVFAGFSLIAVLITWFDIPETKGRSFQELDEMFLLRIPTRQFSSYVPSAGEMSSNAIEKKITADM